MNDTLLLSDMRESVAFLRTFDPLLVLDRLGRVGRERPVLVCGEGSSRILPGKRARARDAARPRPLGVSACGCREAMTFELSNRDIVALSNSGRTAELISLLKGLPAAGGRNGRVVGASSPDRSLLVDQVDAFYPLACGPERAVAATKSVVEQALLVETLCSDAAGEPLVSASDLEALASALDQILSRPVSDEVGSALAPSGTVYLSGSDEGVAEELALKTVEILGRKSAYLEGTLLLHGVEESMEPGDVLILVSPARSLLADIDELFRKAIGVSVVAISDYDTGFPTVLVPSVERLGAFVELAAGWRLLHDSGMAAGRDVDHPKRARKVGNEVKCFA